MHVIVYVWLPVGPTMNEYSLVSVAGAVTGAWLDGNCCCPAGVEKPPV